MSPDAPEKEPESNDLEQAFLDTADAELAAFGKRQTARKVLTLISFLVAMISGGYFVGWAIYHALR
jgi:hypothetical protein